MTEKRRDSNGRWVKTNQLRVLDFLRSTGLEHTTRDIGQSLNPKLTVSQVHQALRLLTGKGLVYQTEGHDRDDRRLYWGATAWT